MTNWHHIVGGTAALIIAAMFFAPLLKIAYERFRNIGVAFVLISAGFLYSMATKPQVTWDDYIKDNGTKWTTNAAGVVTGVNFLWTKTNSLLPSAQTLYIARSPTNETAYVDFITTTVGAFSYAATFANAESYKYWVYHNWEPPSPVHTNGVWLGNVIERAKGARGVEKMVIIKGQLMKDGKVIAP